MTPVTTCDILEGHQTQQFLLAVGAFGKDRDTSETNIYFVARTFQGFGHGIGVSAAATAKTLPRSWYLNPTPYAVSSSLKGSFRFSY